MPLNPINQPTRESERGGIKIQLIIFCVQKTKDNSILFFFSVILYKTIIDMYYLLQNSTAIKFHYKKKNEYEATTKQVHPLHIFMLFYFWLQKYRNLILLSLFICCIRSVDWGYGIHQVYLCRGIRPQTQRVS